MPVMNRLEAARESTRRSPGLPILMVSVHRSDQLANEAKKVGARGACAESDTACVIEAAETKQQKRCCQTALTTKWMGLERSSRNPP